MKTLSSFCIILFSLYILSALGFENQLTSASGMARTDSTSPSFYAVKWYRVSMECQALYRQIFFNVAAIIQKEVTTQHLVPHTWGVIVDIDETLLDNSQWNLNHDVYNQKESWNDYAAKARAIAMPGASEFTHRIHALGGYINLVSNRTVTLLPATEKNLQKEKIEYDQILFDTSKEGTSFVNKTPRFNAIIQGVKPSKLGQQQILAWLGDNATDFPDLPQEKNRVNYSLFGKIYFMFPNPLYGSWEKNPLQ